MKKLQANKKSMANAPISPGVYLFKNAQGTVLYVGKAKNLRNRLKSYYQSNLLPKTKNMIHNAANINYIEVSSEFEALLLEAKLVRKYQPKYNIELRDDKSPLYIVITAEDFPRILTIRQTQITSFKIKHIYGPFISGSSARSIIKNIRRVVPFAQHKPGNRSCVLSQIGLCDPCPLKKMSLKDKSRYKKNVRRVNTILSGRAKYIQRDLEKEMRMRSKFEDYESAGKIKTQIAALNELLSRHTPESAYIQNPMLIEDIRDKEIFDLSTILNKHLYVSKLNRIECYDIAHLGGTYPTASMVTFVNAEADKRYYRHFKVSHNNSDVDNIQEVLKRRLTHLSDWGTPDLIIVDGGKPQVSKALEVVKNIPLVGLAKHYETLVIKKEDKYIELRLQRGPALNLIQRLRDEAHRFARRLHHKQVSKAINNK
ncbi:hypothetical protein C4564_06005 [Candidatus Microgenomates bacterium]|nr:MAG: hypothetical protein C4564_06005 [Candidatus Microgenomates bacterium]